MAAGQHEVDGRGKAEAKKLLLYAAAFVSIGLLSGTVYGWPAMRRLLRREGVLAAGCADRSAAAAAGDAADAPPCEAEELRLGLVYTLGSYANQFARLPLGLLLDAVGPRRTIALSTALFAAGSLLFGLSDSLGAIVAGFAAIGAGGAGVQLGLQSASGLFPARRALAMSGLSAAFQISSLLYLGFERLQGRGLADGRSGAAMRATLLGAHAAVALAVGLVGLGLWADAPPAAARPQHAPPAAAADQKATRAAAVQDAPPAAAAAQVAARPAAGGAGARGGGGDSPPGLRGRPFIEQVRSAEYLVFLAFFSNQMLAAQFTAGTMGAQLELRGDADGRSTTGYAIAFAASAATAPLAGAAADAYGFPPVMAAVTASLMLSYALLAVPSLAAANAAGAFYSVGRVCLWALWFAFVAAEFGFGHYGKLAGGGLAVGAVVSLLQYAALTAVVGERSSGDGALGGYDRLNVGWCVLSACQFPLIWLLARKQAERRRRRGKAVDIDSGVGDS